MELYAMTPSAVEQATQSMQDTYSRYYTDSDNAWMRELWGDDIFVQVGEVPDFTLADPSGYRHAERGKLDMENCIRMYDGLRELTPAQASQETFWAGMCNDVFYSYMRERWGYSPEAKRSAKDAGAIIARFFYRKSFGGSYFRNTLAKCWWIPHLLYDAERPHEPYWRLRELGTGNFSTKVTDIFFNYGFARSRHVLHGIVLGIMRARQEEIPIDLADKCLRPALKHLNATGGLILLDSLTSEEVAAILVEGARMAVADQVLSYEDEDELEEYELDEEAVE